MHIGLVGGIGPAATEYYYRGLIELHGGSGIPLELTIVHADVRELAQNLANHDARLRRDPRRGPLSMVGWETVAMKAPPDVRMAQCARRPAED